MSIESAGGNPQNGEKSGSDTRPPGSRSSRRGFLQGFAATVGAATVLPSSAESSATDHFDDIRPEAKPVLARDPLEEQIERGEIVLDEKTLAEIREYWKVQYSRGGERYGDLEDALERMSPWFKYLTEAFEGEGVPKQYALLCIPESHFQTGATSGAGAVGPFQIKPQTASTEPVNLEINEVIDERCDPVQSARGAARLLKYLYEEMGEDWNLALSAYNGGYAWQYAKEQNLKPSGRSYEGFLAYLQECMNTTLGELASYTVQPTDTLSHISRETGFSTEALRKYNANVSDTALRVGLRLVLPGVSAERAKREMAGYWQNAEYPHKLRGIFDALIDEHRPRMQSDTLAFSEYRIPSIDSSGLVYQAVVGDTVSGIAQAHNVSLGELMRANPGLRDPAKLAVGQELVIPVAGSRGQSLEEVAHAFDVSVDQLQMLNPAMLDATAPLPEQYVVRVPSEATYASLDQ